MPIKIIDRNSSKLIVYFGSIKGKVEFYNTFKNLNFSVIYFLDDKTSWFSNLEFGNLAQSISYLQKEISNINAKNIMFSGISMGGFGAILFAKYLKPDKVIVFSPQIDLSYGNAKNFKQFIKHRDLNLIKKLADYNVPTDVHIGENESKEKNYWGDKHHAQLLSRFNCVNIIEYKGFYKHNPAAMLKETDQIHTVFKFG